MSESNLDCSRVDSCWPSRQAFARKRSALARRVRKQYKSGYPSGYAEQPSEIEKLAKMLVGNRSVVATIGPSATRPKAEGILAPIELFRGRADGRSSKTITRTETQVLDPPSEFFGGRKGSGLSNHVL